MNRKIIYFSLLSLLLLFTVQDACARKKKEKSAKTEIKGYENHLKDCVASDSTGLMIMHRTKDKVLVEFPVRLLEKEMLLASSIINISDNGEGVVGQFTSPEVMFRFVRNGKKLEARMMTNQPLMREETGKEGVASSLLKSASGGVYKSFKIEAFAKDSSSVLVNLAPLFLEHSDYSNPFSSYAPNSMYGMVTRKFRCDTSRSFLKDIHSYPDNISVTCVLGYDVDYTAFGTITMQRNVPVTVTAARMLVLLPETPMDIRYANQKVNTAFLVRKQYVDEMSPLKSTHLVKRWRLEPSDKAAFKRGEKVEPKKPIVFYIDTLMPDSWKPYIKEGVEEWNKSFERIGYLNAVQAKEWPKGTDFSSSNIRHSSICYAPDWMYMAQTSMHTDPRTGEILNASIYIHHNFLSLLYSGRCTQTMASDPTARTLTLSEKQMGELLKVGIAQQVGRCLGLTDNMGASYHYPVDSLRSAEFTRQHGLTASVVADKPEKELVTLNKWVEDAYTAHEYHYGPRQEFYALYDPTALYWDLGDDPFKAADYQIQNLKISIANFMKWYAKEDYDISRRAELYASLIKLFTNRAMELSFWIGGLYLDEGKEERSFPVSKEMQQKALNYLVKMSMDLDWLTNAEVKSSLELQDLIVDKTRKYIFQLLFDRIRYVALCSEKSDGEYSVKNYMDDIHSIVWKGVLQNRVLTNTEMLYQNAFIDYLVKNISKNMGGGTAKNAGRQQALRGDSFKMDIFNEANSFVMGWQAQDMVSVNSHQDASVYWNMLLKIRTLLNSRISSASSDMKEYYDFLIYKIDKLLDEK